MSRPIKAGLDYFSFDVHSDNKLKLIGAEFGLTGFAVIVKLWQIIYAERGYYCEFDEEVALLFASENGVGGNVVSEIVGAAIKRGIFDKGMYDNYKILTSHGIQARYLEAKRRGTRVVIEKRYLLLSSAEFSDNVYINEVFVDNNSINVYKSTQRKEKEIKENKIKENESIAQVQKHAHGKYKNVFLSVDEFAELQITFSDWKEKIEHLSYAIEVHGYKYNNHFAVIHEWAEKDKEAENKRRTKRNPFDNYDDGNRRDYTDLDERVMDEILSWGTNKEENKDDEYNEE